MLGERCWANQRPEGQGKSLAAGENGGQEEGERLGGGELWNDCKVCELYEGCQSQESDRDKDKHQTKTVF